MMNFLIALLVVLSGCSSKDGANVRHYTEEVSDTEIAVAITDPHQGMMPRDMAQVHVMPTVNTALKDRLIWTLPQGWQQAASGSMRLAAFQLTNNPEAIDVSIVVLGGNAGGLQANIKRWLGQVNIQVDDTALNQFIDSSKDNIFDFTQLQQRDDDSVESMIVAMLNLEDNTVFVKMKGSKRAIKANKTQWLNLVKSITLKE